jgi:hypothetical protein
MNNYTADDIYVLNAFYLHSYCQTPQHYTFLISFLQYHGLVQEYSHFLESGELPSQVTVSDSSEEYLQDTYDYKSSGRTTYMPVFIHSRHRIKRVTFEIHILNLVFIVKIRVYQITSQQYR